MVVISVADTHMGIASGHLPQIFERFYRVEATHARSSRSFRLGLVIVQAIVQLHSGHIDY
jgi:signal transduction histidine kinase